MAKEVKMPTIRRGREDRAADRQKFLQQAAKAAEALTHLSSYAEREAKMTDAQIAAEQNERFRVIRKMTESSVSGITRAMICSGDPGLGKTYEIDDVLKKGDPDMKNHTRVSGFAKATGLYKQLYSRRSEGQTLILDDCDSVFFDPVAINMLKAACDTTRERHLAYLSEHQLEDEETGEKIPTQFEFQGTLIFITNLDFDALCDNDTAISPHLKAMVSRAHYIDVGMKSRRAKLIRIKEVLKQGLLKNRQFTKTQQDDIVSFVEANQGILRELSLRIVVKIADLMVADPKDWRNLAKVTCCRVH